MVFLILLLSWMGFVGTLLIYSIGCIIKSHYSPVVVPDTITVERNNDLRSLILCHPLRTLNPRLSIPKFRVVG